MNDIDISRKEHGRNELISDFCDDVLHDVPSTHVDKFLLLHSSYSFASRVSYLSSTVHLTSYFSTWWRHQMGILSALLPICAGISPVTGEFPHKGQWRGALMFSLICGWINDWVNKREAGDLRRYRAHYYVIVMELFWLKTTTDAKRANYILRNFTCSYRNRSWYNSQNCKSIYWT